MGMRAGCGKTIGNHGARYAHRGGTNTIETYGGSCRTAVCVATVAVAHRRRVGLQGGCPFDAVASFGRRLAVLRSGHRCLIGASAWPELLIF